MYSNLHDLYLKMLIQQFHHISIPELSVGASTPHIMASNLEIDLKGIAVIEKFLDDIEDDNEYLESLQKQFDNILEKNDGCLESSPAFLANKMKSDQLSGTVDPPVKAGKNISDGFENCVFKGLLDERNQPCGEGTLVYSMTESFTGIFEGSLRNRSGVRMFSGEIGRAHV